MGCNCKNKNNIKNLAFDEVTLDFNKLKSNYPIFGNFILYFGKIILFLSSTILVTIILLPVSLFFCFKLSFISNEIDLTSNLLKFIKKLKGVNISTDKYSKKVNKYVNTEYDDIVEENVDLSDIELLNNNDNK